ncbi:MAG: winged helix-turn-helix transcriptional regulator [Candidatus Helarchaeota archaeon]
MSGTKKNVAVILTLIMVFAFFVLSLLSIGIAVLSENKHITGVGGNTLNVQNQQLIVNDMTPATIQGGDVGGIVIINQSEILTAGGLLISSFFIYFIVATNVQDFNLFPSQTKLNQSTRQQIYDVIAQNEGIHLREICRMLNKKMGVIQYHIYILESAKLINSMKDGRYKRFFVNHYDNPEHRTIIALLQRETTGKVLNLIYQQSIQGRSISHTTIAKELGSSNQALTWHIHKLEDAGIISILKRGSQKYYQINTNILPILEALL